MKRRLQRTGDSAGTTYGSFRWAMQGADHHARALKKANGEVTRSPEEVKAMWYQHFYRVLTIRSDYSHDVVEEFPALPVDPALDEPPSQDNLLLALRRMKRGKAGGQTGILPELLIAGGEELITRMLKVMEGVWREGEVVEE